MKDFDFQVRGLQQVRQKIADLPIDGRRVAVEAMSDAIVEELRDLSPYTYVSRADAYPGAPAGPGWFSAAQRRYVMAAIARGDIQIPYRRTGKLSSGWKVERAGLNSQIVNDVPYAPYVQGTYTQSNHEFLVGHSAVGAVLLSNARKIADAAQQAIDQWILDGTPKRP